MKEFRIGDVINLKVNSKVKIKQLLGEGGQGIVYLVEMNGFNYAMKWYKKPPKTEFYNNLEKNIQSGAPTSAFLWPQYLTEKKDKKFGYLMSVRPPDYVELSDFLIARSRFKSISAMIQSALIISNGFRELHRAGFSYQDLNDGNFFINPQTGDVLICDNDNIAPNGITLGIAGKSRYMAPEVVRGEKKPNADTDRFSLSVILFLILFNNHPLEGKSVVSIPCLTERNERFFYGSNPVFIFDPDNDTNRPVQGIHGNVIRRWSIYPEFIRGSFIQAFNKELLMCPEKRMMENDWQKIFIHLRDVTIKCSCGGETFIDPDIHNTCMNCGKVLGQPLTLDTENNRLVLFPGTKIYLCHTNELSDDFNQVSGEIIQNKKNSSLWGIKNLTKEAWIATMPDGNYKTIPPQAVAPIYKGVLIVFNGSKKGVIK